MVTDKAVEILLIEDNSGDVILVQEAFKEGKGEGFDHLKINVVEDGERAIEYLNKEGGYQNAAQPDLIILDLNLPKKNGHEVLNQIRKREDFKKIPVIVLTTSHSESDVIKSYDLGATCFITKPFGFHKFMEAAETIKNFWLRLVTLPSKS